MTREQVSGLIARHCKEYEEMMTLYPESGAILTLHHIETMRHLLARLEAATE